MKKNTNKPPQNKVPGEENWEKLAPLSTIIKENFDEIESRSLGTSVAGIPVTFYDLDAMTQGLSRGELIVMGGRPAMGKTSMALNMAMNVAQCHDLPVCIFSLEMSKKQVAYRLISMEVGIESQRLRTGRLWENEWSILGKGINELDNKPIFINDKGSITVEEMSEECQRIKEEQGKELGLVVIDYVQLMEGSFHLSRDEELSKIIIQLKGMAKKLKVPVVLLSQLSRTVEYRKDRRPMLSDLRETQSLETHSDLVIMLYRDEYYNPDTEERNLTELIVCKHRNGPIGTVKLLFEPTFTRFRNLAS